MEDAIRVMTGYHPEWTTVNVDFVINRLGEMGYVKGGNDGNGPWRYADYALSNNWRDWRYLTWVKASDLHIEGPEHNVHFVQNSGVTSSWENYPADFRKKKGEPAAISQQTPIGYDRHEI